MFEISQGESGSIVLKGRLDASQCDTARSFLDHIDGPVTADLSGLTYLSSAGMGVLLKTQKRLMGNGGGLVLVNVSNHIFDVFRYSGFNQVFEIHPASR